MSPSVSSNVVDMTGRLTRNRGIDSSLTRNRVIALSGWRGSGKDTVSDYLVEKYGYHKISLAVALKDQCAYTYGIERHMFDDRVLKDAPIVSMPVVPSDKFCNAIHHLLGAELSSGYWTPRALCILEGSMKRAVSSGHWMRKAIEAIRMISDGRYVISDMRYVSEADSLRALLPREELLLMRINRFESIDTQDPSERDLDDYRFDVTMGNAGNDLEALHSTLDWMMANLGIAPRSTNAD